MRRNPIHGADMWIGRCFPLLLVACGNGQTSESSGWSEGAPVAHGAIQETAAVALRGKIYVLGGLDADENTLDLVQVYDTQARQWTADGPPLPRALNHVNAASDGETIYVLGGLSGIEFTAVGDVYRFTPGTDHDWKRVSAMPAERERGAAVAGSIDGKIYVAGGQRDGHATQLVDVYDPIRDAWTSLADLPIARDHACGGVLDGQLVVAGGRDGQLFADVRSYDPATNEWTRRSPMPTARAGMGCGVIESTLYTAGGEGNTSAATGVFDQVESYVLSLDQWITHPPMPTAKHGVGGAVWNGAMYLCGGATTGGFGAVSSTDVFRP